MVQTTKVSSLLKELKRAQNLYENKRLILSNILFTICKNAPVTERLIFGKLGIAESTWNNYKKKGLPFGKIEPLIEVLKTLSFDNQPLVK